MNPVTLARCVRCDLRWVPDRELVCPRCKLNHSVPSEPVLVAKVAVPVKEVVAFGARLGLADPEVRRGLDRLVLGDRCSHGYVTRHICPECSCNNVVRNVDYPPIVLPTR